MDEKLYPPLDLPIDLNEHETRHQESDSIFTKNNSQGLTIVGLRKRLQLLIGNIPLETRTAKHTVYDELIDELCGEIANIQRLRLKLEQIKSQLVKRES